MSHKKLLPAPAAFALSAIVLTGCLGTEAPAPDRPETAMGASTLGGSWTAFPSAWPSANPAFTTYSMTGWTIWPFDPVAGNYKVRRFNNGTPAFVSGSLVDIDLEANSILWGINASGAVLKNSDPYSANGGTWQTVCSGCGAVRIATGASGGVYIVKVVDSPRSIVRKYQPSNNTWIDVPGQEYITDIDVDNNGDLYVAGYTSVWRKPGGNLGAPWDVYSPVISHTLREIAVGGGKIFVLNNDLDEYGSPVYQLNRTTRQFDALPYGNRWKLHVNAAGGLWATNLKYDLFRYNP